MADGTVSSHVRRPRRGGRPDQRGVRPPHRLRGQRGGRRRDSRLVDAACAVRPRARCLRRRAGRSRRRVRRPQRRSERRLALLARRPWPGRCRRPVGAGAACARTCRSGGGSARDVRLDRRAARGSPRGARLRDDPRQLPHGDRARRAHVRPLPCRPARRSELPAAKRTTSCSTTSANGRSPITGSSSRGRWRNGGTGCTTPARWTRRCGSWPRWTGSRPAWLSAGRRCTATPTAVGFRRSACSPAFRSRGLGTALLVHAFGEFQRRGRRRVGLGVDAENTTGAVRLYERAGMHVVRRWHIWETPA